MLNDVPFEAAFLRAAVLVGLVHEREIPDWASSLLHPASRWTPRLANVAAERAELSAIREALRPLAASADLHRVASSILTAVIVEQAVQPRAAIDVLTMLGQIRQEFRRHLPEATVTRIKSFENRVMFALAHVPGQVIPEGVEVDALLGEICGSGHFRFYFHDSEELVTFVAALSRKIVRERKNIADAAAGVVVHAWLLRDPAGHADAVVLNQPALLIAAREFAPLPTASRIPYDPPSTATGIAIVDGHTVSALGVDEVRSRLALWAENRP